MLQMERVEQDTPILVASFSGEHKLEQAIAALEKAGIARDYIGALIPSPEGPTRACMVSVLLPRGYQDTVQRIFEETGALRVGLPGEFQAVYGGLPHPGVYENHDMKFRMGGEFPNTGYAPALSGYRVRPSTLDPRDRVWMFDEVELGYTFDEALAESQRCLHCPEPRCQEGCPAHNDIPAFVAALRGRDLEEAAGILRRSSSFPAVCGRVCDKSRQCEGSCSLGLGGGDPVAIGMLERFVGDAEMRDGRRMQVGKRPSTGKRVAIVGSGPSGLAAAGVLANKGHSVTIFEAMPVAGGALAWGIPTFRLPPEV